MWRTTASPNKTLLTQNFAVSDLTFGLFSRWLLRRTLILAGEIESERSDFKGHLLVFGHRARRLEIKEVQLIVVRLDFDAPAEG